MSSQVSRARRSFAKAAGEVAGSTITASVVIVVAIAVAIFVASGVSPFLALSELLSGSLTGSGLRNTISRTVAIGGMAIAFAIPYRAGTINLGGEGQMIAGGLAGAITAILLPGPDPLAIACAVLAGLLAGALWALLPAIGESWLGAPILITSLLLNYVARAVTSYLVRFHFLDPLATSVSTESISVSRRIPTIPFASGVTASVIGLVLLVAAVSVFNRRRVVGYETLVTGFEPGFARYGGIGIERQRIWLMAIAGAIGGGVGALVVVGQLFVYTDGDLVGTAFAWTGLLVALLAPRKPALILVAAFMFAALQAGALAMQRSTGIPWQLAQVLQAVAIIVFVGRFVLVRSKGSKRPEDEQPLDPVDTPSAEEAT